MVPDRRSPSCSALLPRQPNIFATETVTSRHPFGCWRLAAVTLPWSSLFLLDIHSFSSRFANDPILHPIVMGLKTAVAFLSQLFLVTRNKMKGEPLARGRTKAKGRAEGSPPLWIDHPPYFFPIHYVITSASGCSWHQLFTLWGIFPLTARHLDDYDYLAYV
jgi:hypothetical protein